KQALFENTRARDTRCPAAYQGAPRSQLSTRRPRVWRRCRACSGADYVARCSSERGRETVPSEKVIQRTSSIASHGGSGPLNRPMRKREVCFGAGQGELE